MAMNQTKETRETSSPSVSTLASPLLKLSALTVRHRTAHGVLEAVREVDLTVYAGQTLALIGESGCGKTSLGKAVVGLNNVSNGGIYFDGSALGGLTRRGWKPHRSAVQMVFQDPLSALDPRQKARQAVTLPLRLHSKLDRAAQRARISELMAQVGLDEALLERYPHQLSGGQRQRLNIARALAPGPRLIVCDEPVSALDVSLQAQIVTLLKHLQQTLGIALLFISHDLSVVESIADHIAVMYLGRVVEVLPKAALWSAQHPYTRLLLASIPRTEPRPRGDLVAESVTVDPSSSGGVHENLVPSNRRTSDPPDPFAQISGCAFHARCPNAQQKCQQLRPPATRAGDAHLVSCFFPILPDADKVHTQSELA